MASSDKWARRRCRNSTPDILTFRLCAAASRAPLDLACKRANLMIRRMPPASCGRRFRLVETTRPVCSPRAGGSVKRRTIASAPDYTCYNVTADSTVVAKQIRRLYLQTVAGPDSGAALLAISTTRPGHPTFAGDLFIKPTMRVGETAAGAM